MGESFAGGAVFGTILISAVTLMHIYVFWRAASVPFMVCHVPRTIFIGVGVVLWVIFFFGRVIGHDGTGVLARTLELLGMNWMGILFLIFISLLAMDLLTLFGILMPRLAPTLRGWAMLVGVVLSLIALIQGLRSPVIQKYEVSIPSLPRALDGTVLVALSDMHLGSQLGDRWLAARVAQVNGLKPDLVVLLGDIFEGHGAPGERLIETFKQLSAPLGIWAVPGNHEFHGGGDMSLFNAASFTLLRNGWVQIRPGLVLAGVDDLTAARRKGQAGDSVSEALTGLPSCATILLSHTPWQAGRAAKAGAGLMLSGHTHGGQIWPFGYLIRSRYPFFEGRYEVDGMPIIVCRGTGTWGPRMRLWRPAEILRVTLRGTGDSAKSVSISGLR
jgi:predicted MPP superfamily phosphohydrolase